MMVIVTRQNPDELYHFGTKGMRWGVRKYQNSDGSLTPAGVKRYSDGNGGSTQRKNVYDINAAYYNKRANKLEARARKNRTIGSMNRDAANKSSGLISKVYAINTNYYQKKADKLSKRANKNRIMANMNAQASKQKSEAKAAKIRAKLAKESANAVSTSKQASSGKAEVQRMLRKKSNK